MLKVNDLKKSYGTTPLFEGVSFSIDAGERVGLIGRNGHGKSTLLKIITGQEYSDSGEVYFSKGYKPGFLEQHLNFKEKTILEVACASMSVSEDGTDMSYKAKAILQGLGFVEAQFSDSPGSLSGGYQIRLNLAKLLVSEPDLLLLDEPTNYLDILSVRWLIKFLNQWTGEMILITHDRDFMDSVITHTLGIHRQKVRKIEGQTQKYYQLIADEEELTQKTRENQLKKRKETEQFINRFRAKASKAKAVQSRIKALEKEELAEELGEIKSLDFKFPYVLFRGDWPVHVKSLSFAYPEGKKLISKFSFSLKSGDRIAIIGKNGKGKTTLLNLLAKETVSNESEDQIQIAEKTIVSFFGQTNINRLNHEATIEEEIASANQVLGRSLIRSICGAMLFSGDAAEKQIAVLSGGERARVLLGKLLAKPANLLLLDEPTNHLDMDSGRALCKAMKSYPGSIVFVSHDEGLLKKVATRLIIFDRNKITLFDGGYQDFLDKIGWEDEDGEETKKQKKNPQLSQAEIKKLRSQINRERQTLIKPLSNKISKLENKIIEYEAEINQNTKKMLELSGAEVAQLSRSIGRMQGEIDLLFEQMEGLAEQQAKIEKDFKEKLDAI